MFTIEVPLSLMEKRTLPDWAIHPQLRGIPRAADMNALGGEMRAVTVGQVATVRIGSLTRYSTVNQDGKTEALQGLVLAMRGANAQGVVAQTAQIVALAAARVELDARSLWRME